MKVTEYLCESYDEHTRQWVKSKHYYTLDEIAGFANSRPLMETAREGERAGQSEWAVPSTGFPGPGKPETL